MMNLLDFLSDNKIRKAINEKLNKGELLSLSKDSGVRAERLIEIVNSDVSITIEERFCLSVVMD